MKLVTSIALTWEWWKMNILLFLQMVTKWNIIFENLTIKMTLSLSLNRIWKSNTSRYYKQWKNKKVKESTRILSNETLSSKGKFISKVIWNNLTGQSKKLTLMKELQSLKEKHHTYQSSNLCLVQIKPSIIFLKRYSQSKYNFSIKLILQIKIQKKDCRSIEIWKILIEIGLNLLRRKNMFTAN